MFSDQDPICIFKNKENKKDQLFNSKHRMTNKINKKKINNHFNILFINKTYKTVLFNLLNTLMNYLSKQKN